MAPTVAIQDLRIGMYIQLDLGWMSHPFPLSSFRIASAEQIATLRALGLARVRWLPERSQLDEPGAQAPDVPETAGPADTPRATAQTPLAAEADAPAAADAPDGRGRGPAGPVAAEASATPLGATMASPSSGSPTTAPDRIPPRPPVDPAGARPATAVAPGEARRLALAAERAGQRRVERQYGAAAQALREAVRSAPDRPQAAHRAVVALSSSMVEQLRADGEPCIRLIGSGVPSVDRETAHGLNVAVLSLLLGRQTGLGADVLVELGVGALLHDVGLQALPARLREPDPARPAELQAWRAHVGHGVALGERMGLGTQALATLAQHHELADGHGFPLGLKGDVIAPAARLVALVDRYDDLCNPPPGSAPLTPHEALSLLYTQGRTRHDPTLLAAFIHLMGVYPAGSAVQLSDDRYALVVTVDPARPLQPRVLVHDPRTPVDEALLLDLGRADGLSIRRSLAPSRLPPAVLQYLAPRPRPAWFFDHAHAPAAAAGAAA